MKRLDRELELTSRAVLAAEDWSPAYARAPKQHAELIKLAAKLHRQTVVYLRDVSKHAPEFVNWFEYTTAVFEQQRQMGMHADSLQAYDVNVVVKQDNLNQTDQEFIKIVFDTLATTIATGVESMVIEHKMPLGLTPTSAIIQNLTTEQLAHLVGMKVNKDGSIVPNPNAAYNIDETTRTRIANSIKTSIRLGESQEQAIKRLQKVIADPARADLIAHTEAVRAYATGRATYAKQAGANYKAWYDRNAVDVCADNTSEGPIPIEANFIGGVPCEPQHPRCLCLTVYLWAGSEDEARSQMG